MKIMFFFYKIIKSIVILFKPSYQPKFRSLSPATEWSFAARWLQLCTVSAGAQFELRFASISARRVGQRVGQSAGPSAVQMADQRAVPKAVQMAVNSADRSADQRADQKAVPMAVQTAGQWADPTAGE